AGDGTIGPPADLYALAHIAYALLVGRAYWMDEQETLPMYAFMNKMITGLDEPPSVRAKRSGVELPAAFDAWFTRATSTSPEERSDGATPQTADPATALGTAAPRQLLANPPPLGERLSTPGRRWSRPAPHGGAQDAATLTHDPALISPSPAEPVPSQP